MDIKLDLKGFGGLSQVKKGEEIPDTENSLGRYSTFEWKTASRSLGFISL